MNIIDIAIVILILFGGLLGFKRGFTKSVIKCVGFILTVVLAFLFKDIISSFLYEHLPFFNFGGSLKGIGIINVFVYELIAFLVVLGILNIGLKVLLLASTIFEKLLNATIILGIPSKLMGMIVGMIEYFVIIFLGLYVLSLPFFKLDIINSSKLKDKILNNTPVLSSFIDSTVIVIDEFANLKEQFEDEKISSYTFNCNSVKLFLDNKILSEKSFRTLVEKGKLSDCSERR